MEAVDARISRRQSVIEETKKARTELQKSLSNKVYLPTDNAWTNTKQRVQLDIDRANNIATKNKIKKLDQKLLEYEKALKEDEQYRKDLATGKRN